MVIIYMCLEVRWILIQLTFLQLNPAVAMGRFLFYASLVIHGGLTSPEVLLLRAPFKIIIARKRGNNIVQNIVLKPLIV